MEITMELLVLRLIILSIYFISQGYPEEENHQTIETDFQVVNMELQQRKDFTPLTS